jgi:hypothetical protein
MIADQYLLISLVVVLVGCLGVSGLDPILQAATLKPAKVYDLQDPSVVVPAVDDSVASEADVQKEIGSNILPINRRCFKKGMTFAIGGINSTFGIQKFKCNAPPTNDKGTNNCDQFYGDTWCYKKRRILCINKLRLNRPAYPVAAGQAASEGWSEGIVQATPQVMGCSFATKNDVDAYCTKLFGCNYIGAEFHDGRYISAMNGPIFANFSWNTGITTKGFSSFWTYVQNFPTVSERYWVSHMDVYGANPNCWN